MDLLFIFHLVFAVSVALGHEHRMRTELKQTPLTINNIAPSIREHWIRKANKALSDVHGDPCPFNAFGAAIVNHTAPGVGELVCIGANSNYQRGDPTQHGEISAIQNCTRILTSPSGPYNLSATAALEAFTQLSLYTNAEPCPMCASAIRWAGFKECIYGTSIDALIEKGWGQIRISSMDVFKESSDLPGATRLVSEVLRNETDVHFGWQFDAEAECPKGCKRSEGKCKAVGK